MKLTKEKLITDMAKKLKISRARAKQTAENYLLLVKLNDFINKKYNLSNSVRYFQTHFKTRLGYYCLDDKEIVINPYKSLQLQLTTLGHEASHSLIHQRKIKSRTLHSKVFIKWWEEIDRAIEKKIGLYFLIGYNLQLRKTCL